MAAGKSGSRGEGQSGGGGEVASPGIAWQPVGITEELRAAALGRGGNSLVPKYKLDRGPCELCEILDAMGFDCKWDCYGCEVNHIWSMNRRPNVWPNLICLCVESHRWFHRELVPGRVACLYAKWLMSEYTRDDWWPDLMDLAAGKIVRGWLESQTLERPFTAMRAQMLSRWEGRLNGIV